MTTVIEIDALVLDGMTEAQGYRVAQAFGTAFAALVERHGLPADLGAAEDARLDLGDLQRAGPAPEALGREIAGALFDRVRR